MNATRTAPAPVVVSAREDLVTLAIPGKDASREALREARKIAAKAAHTLVGGAQNVRNAKHDGRMVTLADYAPVRKRQAGAETAPAGDPRDALIAELEAKLAELRGAPAQTTPAREVPPVIAKRIAASHALTCKTCRDLRVVRGVGSDAGKHYRTLAGAQAATAAGRSAKCPACKGKGKVRAA